jgi:hypothetical protein
MTETKKKEGKAKGATPLMMRKKGRGRGEGGGVENLYLMLLLGWLQKGSFEGCQWIERN